MFTIYTIKKKNIFIKKYNKIIITPFSQEMLLAYEFALS